MSFTEQNPSSTGDTGLGGTSGTSGTSSAKETAQETAQTAKDEASRVAGVASSEAQNVASEAKAQARNLLDDARTQIDQQSRSQLSSLKDVLVRLGDDLEQMAQGGSVDSGLASDAARMVSERVRGLGNHLDSREPADLLDDVRDFARRRPGTFLFGALAAGVVAGRLARGAKASSSGSTGGSLTGTSSYAGTTGLGGGYDTGYQTGYDSGLGTGVGSGGMGQSALSGGGAQTGDEFGGPTGTPPAAGEAPVVTTGTTYGDEESGLGTDPIGGRHTGYREDGSL